MINFKRYGEVGGAGCPGKGGGGGIFKGSGMSGCALPDALSPCGCDNESTDCTTAPVLFVVALLSGIPGAEFPDSVPDENSDCV